LVLLGIWGNLEGALKRTRMTQSLTQSLTVSVGVSKLHECTELTYYFLVYNNDVTVVNYA